MASTSIFIDTSWFKVFIDESDDFHDKAVSQSAILSQQKQMLITTNFIVDETLTLLRVRKGLDLALKFRDFLSQISSHSRIVRLLSLDEFKAWEWFPKNWSKLSFTDCTSFAIMQRLDLNDVATFDDHFTRAGFNVLS